MCTHEQACAAPARLKHTTKTLKENEDGWSMSWGVEAYIQADKPNPGIDNADAINEHDQGPG